MKLRFWFIGGSAALIAIAATVTLLQGPPSETDGAQDTAAKSALTVTKLLPELLEWNERLSASGNVTAWQEAIVGSELGGVRLVEIGAEVGDVVRKGDVLARLQKNTIAAAYDQTRASLTEAEATFIDARANADRARKLKKSGAFSSQKIEQYLTNEIAAKARFDGLKARLKNDEIRLAQTQLVAPDDGTITSCSAILGAVVQPGQELFRLIRRDRLEWRAELIASDLERVKPGMPVKIKTTGNDAVSGVVRVVAPSVNRQTRVGLVYVDLDSSEGVSAGMFASGNIVLAKSKQLTLPQRAVLLRDGYSYVFRLSDDNHVLETKVQTGQRLGDRVAIMKGLEEGVPVVASGVGFLSDGDLVRVVDAPTAQ